MTARQSAAVDAALDTLRRTGQPPRLVAAQHGIAPSSLYRAMRRAGMQVAPVGRPARENAA